MHLEFQRHSCIPMRLMATFKQTRRTHPYDLSISPRQVIIKLIDFQAAPVENPPSTQSLPLHAIKRISQFSSGQHPRRAMPTSRMSDIQTLLYTVQHYNGSWMTRAPFARPRAATLASRTTDLHSCRSAIYLACFPQPT